VDAHVVFAGDDYDLRLGTDPAMVHVPKPGIDRTKTQDIIAAYAVVRLRDGSTYFEWLWRDEIDARRARSDGAKAFDEGKAKSTPWSTDYAAMARKTAIRALFTSGRVPMADQLGFAAAVMDEEAAPAMHQAALAAMASEMQAEGKDATILGTSEPVEEESPPTDLSTEIGRMEAEIGPERTAAIRKECRIGPDVKAADISPLLADPYRKALLAAMPA